MESVFTIKGVFKEAYAIIKPKFWTVIGQFALIFVAYMVISGGLQHIFVLRTLAMILYMFVVTIFSLSYVEKGSFSFDDITKALTLKRFCYFLVTALLFALSVLGGVLLLIIPGLIFAICMCFYKYIILENDLSPIEALKQSIRTTKGYRWKIFWFYMLGGLVMLLGVLCLFVGLFFTIPLVLIADTLVYKKLSHLMKPEATEEVVEEAVVIEAVVV
jgi:uncharacterized membrane protein